MSEASRAAGGPSVEVETVCRTRVGAFGRRAPSWINGFGRSVQRHSGSGRQEFFDLLDPVSGKVIRVRASELGDKDLGPRSVLAGAVSGERALHHVRESVLKIFDKGRELEIMLFKCREHELTPKEEPPSS